MKWCTHWQFDTFYFIFFKYFHKFFELIGFSTNDNLSISIIICYVANDNTNGQVVVSGKIDQLKKFMDILKEKKIKNIKLPVSAPFHCPLMNKASEIMSEEIQKLDIKMPKIKILSNVNAKEVKNVSDLKKLLISQIESRVRWREIINSIIHNNCNNFIEIGPGKVLSGMIKRLAKNINVNSFNSIEDMRNYKIND